MATASEIKVFIQKLGKLAVNECNKRIAQGKGFVLPSVCIAQSALETGWGTSGLMVRANAFFGIKAGGSWTGKVYTAGTWEVQDGQAYNTTANFRAYDSLEASVSDYYDLIGNASRYANALSYGADVSAWKTAYQCIHAIWSGGYATDTLYVEKIMNTINARNLIEYDGLITGVPTGDTGTGTGTSLAEITKIFKKSDLVQGKIVATDSGRTFGNDTTDTTAIALDWNKAITINADTTFKIDGIGDYILAVASITGESLSITHNLKNGDTFEAKAGQIIGFYLTNEEETELLIENMKDTFEVDFVSESLPQGMELYSSPIAYFTKIE